MYYFFEYTFYYEFKSQIVSLIYSLKKEENRMDDKIYDILMILLNGLFFLFDIVL